jgi:hypothetical protein
MVTILQRWSSKVEKMNKSSVIKYLLAVAKVLWKDSEKKFSDLLDLELLILIELLIFNQTLQQKIKVNHMLTKITVIVMEIMMNILTKIIILKYSTYTKIFTQ